MCKNLQVRSTISPDGQYLISGSEDGKPRIWDASLEQMYKTGAYECKLLDMVSDCVWNPRYNMFAVCGFGQHFPVLVYAYQRNKEELDKILLAGGGVQIGSDRASEFMAQKSKLGNEEKTPKRRTARTVSIDNENDNILNTDQNNRMQVPMTLDVSYLTNF